jgi:hypothetical protein
MLLQAASATMELMMSRRLRTPATLIAIALLSLFAASGYSCSAASTNTVTAVDDVRQDLYVDCFQGRDTNSGVRTSPLRTFRKAAAAPRPAGSTIYLARGCSWSGSTTLRGDGAPTAPVAVTAYGIGAAPKLTGRKLKPEDSVLQLAGTHQSVSEITVAHAPGVGILLGGSDGYANNVEIVDTGIGLKFSAPYSTARAVNLRDLHMVRDTAGGDDDFGAYGFGVESHDITIVDSRCTNCRAPSQDYGYDGGFVEIWNYGDNLTVRGSVGDNTQGILEIGGNASDASVNGVNMTGNVFKESHGGVWIHRNDQFAIPTSNINLGNNTISAESSADPEILGGSVDGVSLTGNIIQTGNRVSRLGPPEHHSCNVYVLAPSAVVGYRLDPTERAGSVEQAQPTVCTQSPATVIPSGY